ncbi:MAG: hypothetical protein AB8E15_11730 [Bdellovibrionales bacterium]
MGKILLFLGFISGFLLGGYSAIAGEINERQAYLMERQYSFDGWQDEGLISIKDKLPKTRRWSSAQLKRKIDDSILAQQKKCLETANEKCVPSSERSPSNTQ